jgi:hypothetical protein
MSAYSRLQERYANILTTPPSPGPSICEVCRRSTDGYSLCYQCHNHRQVLGAEAADVEHFDLVTVVPGTKLSADSHPLTKRAAAGKVAGLVIGRRADRDDPASRSMLKAIASQPFDWEVCVLCRTTLQR